MDKRKLEQLMIKITDAIGFGFQESIYHNALLYYLRKEYNNVKSEVNLDVIHEGVTFGSVRADIIIDNKYIIEMKTVDVIKPKNISQLKRYLFLTKIKTGFVINVNYESYQIVKIF